MLSHISKISHLACMEVNLNALAIYDSAQHQLTPAETLS